MNFYIICLIGLFLSALLVMIVMPSFIKALKNRNVNQVTSEYALDEFKSKEKTPIMGGLLFVVMPIIAYIIINSIGLGDKKVLFVILSFSLYCMVGLSDDVLIIVRNKNDGLSPITRLVMEFCIALVLFVGFRDVINCQITIPFTTIGISINPIIFIGFMALLYMAEANAVNFTDGMDGLCAGVSFISLIPFVIISIIRNDFNVAIFLFCVLGGLLAYLYFNHHPAKIFMGDSGSLTLGFLLGIDSLLATTRTAVIVSMLVPLLAAGVPIIDTFFAIIRRKRSHQPIDQADKGHIHHRLLNSGLSTKKTVLFMWA